MSLTRLAGEGWAEASVRILCPLFARREFAQFARKFRIGFLARPHPDLLPQEKGLDTEVRLGQGRAVKFHRPVRIDASSMFVMGNNNGNDRMNRIYRMSGRAGCRPSGASCKFCPRSSFLAQNGAREF